MRKKLIQKGNFSGEKWGQNGEEMCHLLCTFMGKWVTFFVTLERHESLSLFLKSISTVQEMNPYIGNCQSRILGGKIEPHPSSILSGPLYQTSCSTKSVLVPRSRTPYQQSLGPNHADEDTISGLFVLGFSVGFMSACACRCFKVASYCTSTLLCSHVESPVERERGGERRFVGMSSRIPV